MRKRSDIIELTIIMDLKKYEILADIIMSMMEEYVEHYH